MSELDPSLRENPLVARIVDQEIRRRRKLIWLYVGLLLVPLLSALGFSMFGRSDRELIHREVATEAQSQREKMTALQNQVNDLRVQVQQLQQVVQPNVEIAQPDPAPSGSGKKSGAGPTKERDKRTQRPSTPFAGPPETPPIKQPEPTPTPATTIPATPLREGDSIPLELIRLEATPRNLQPGQEGDFIFEVQIDPKVAASEGCVHVFAQGPVIILGQKLKRIPLDGSGHGIVQGRFRVLNSFSNDTLVPIKAALESCKKRK